MSLKVINTENIEYPMDEFTPLKEEIMMELSTLGCMNRKSLVRITNTPRSTVYDALKSLEFMNLVKSFTRKVNTCGRHSVYWKFIGDFERD